MWHFLDYPFLIHAFFLIPFFTCRMLKKKKLPVVKSWPLHGTAAALSSWIEAQLCFLRNMIQPQFKSQPSRFKKMSRDKLSYLWQHRRKKAIKIIICAENVQEVQSFYFKKCQFLRLAFFQMRSFLALWWKHLIHHTEGLRRKARNERACILFQTAIDDFKHESTKFFSVFLDFRDAFWTLSHNIMIRALEEIHLPEMYTDIIKDVYMGSFIQVIQSGILIP